MYEIRIIPDEDFDLLPYKHAKTAFGLADSTRNIAFIRQTGVRDIDRNTINHEFDELLQKVSPHEEDGIRYKGGFFKKIFRPVLSIASLIPSPIQPLAIAANTGFTIHDIGDRGFRPLDALSLAGPALGAFKGAKAAGPGLLTKTTGALKGAVGLSTAASGFKQSAEEAAMGHLNALRGKPNVSAAGAAIDHLNQLRGGGEAASTAANIGKAVKEAAPQIGSTLAAGNLVRNLAPPQSGAVQNTGTQTLQNFAPDLIKANTSSDKYITDDDVLSAFERIDANNLSRNQQAKQTFRGQSREGNTAFNNLLNQIAASRDKERTQFVDEANRVNEERHKENIKKDLMKLNNLNESQFNDYLNRAKSPNASENLKKVFAAFL